jgi:hypothetical protein
MQLKVGACEKSSSYARVALRSTFSYNLISDRVHVALATWQLERAVHSEQGSAHLAFDLESEDVMERTQRLGVAASPDSMYKVNERIIHFLD